MGYIKVPVTRINPDNLHTALREQFPELIKGEDYHYSLHKEDGSWYLHVDDSVNVAKLTNLLNTYDATPIVPLVVDFGAEIPKKMLDNLVTAVATLRAYLALPTPTAAQSAGALKVLIRVVFITLKRQGF